MARKIGSRYTAHQVLGRGSAGTVWLGEGPDGPVAIKLLREDLASDQDLVGRFVQERTALLSLDHPRIVGVRDLVVDGQDLALVMELVRGTDLRSRLERDRRLVPQAAVAIAADVADGLAAAHAAGVVHRDVKPENVLLDSAVPAGPGGAPPAKLTDFGIARLVDSPRRTRATRIIGTPDYLAPEIIEGLPPRAAVDIYALATVLYELLAGFTPFGGGHPGAVLRRHVTETVEPLPDIPDGLWQILSSCLAKAPASRLTAAELAQRLREQLPGLVGLPALDITAPDDAAEQEPDDGPEPPPPPPAARPRGAVPLVPGSAPDSSRDTHTSLKLPTAGELAAYRRRLPVAVARPRVGDRAAEVRKRRIRVGAAIAAALTLAGIGGYGYVSSRDAGATSRDDPGDQDPDGRHDDGMRAPGVTPTAPTASSEPSPQGDAGSEAPLPRWASFEAVPRPPGVELTGGPRAITESGATYVFARGADANVWYLTRTAYGYGQWQRLTGISTKGDPAVVSPRPGQVDLFSVGTDGLLYRRTLVRGAWQNWFQVDGRTTFDTSPAAASSAPGRIDLVGRTGGDLVTASYVDGQLNTWSLVPTAGRIAGAPGLVSRAEGTLDAFVVRRGDSVVLRVPFANGAWRPAQEVGTLSTTGRPEPVAGGGTEFYVLVRDRAGRLAQAVLSGPGRWRHEPLPAGPLGRPGHQEGTRRGADAPAAAVNRSGLELYVRTEDGGLARATGV
ncbi:serine/threonine protein kinase [Wenjunlia vitaminophila]|uniref:non-specific serine/threonine protein kinase n=1 Tax=Wenjunlia vitaminophila TaxID=76728 RepID=A0A0T6LP21_WENVI|nr:serine/threonine protein kinase [Wenjunlia vitaminophila]